MDAKDLAKISEEVTNRELLEKVYEQILLPAMKKKAENKLRALEIRSNSIPSVSERVVSENLKEIGFNKTLQMLVEEDMSPFLKEKGFSVVKFSPAYLVEIRW